MARGGRGYPASVRRLERAWLLKSAKGRDRSFGHTGQSNMERTSEFAQLTIRALEQLFQGRVPDSVGMRLWNGAFWPDDAPRKAVIALKHPGALREMFLPGTELGLGEAYIYDDFDIEGDIESVFGLTEILTPERSGWSDRLRIGGKLLRLPSRKERREGRRGRAELSGGRHSIDRDRQAVTYHYDISNDFYRLWLDNNMVYSCAYFESPDDDLHTAQERKLDYICRKMRLRAGQRLLDIGCGWGGLVLHAARKYGVDATGITLSRPQADLANDRIQAAGLSGRCRVTVLDYREVDEREGFDALVSVGMFEHVGAAMLPAYFEKALSLMRPGGVFLNHGIAGSAMEKPRKGPTFSDAYVFPDGELVPVHVTLRAAEEVGLEVRDVESLREHYALTLRQWVRRLEARHAEALKFVEEPTYRVWRLFMAGSAYRFSTGRLNLYQSLLIKTANGGSSGVPLTRGDWYRP
jgi:cyclopropane-fatty-acyl-phospholipid synthase